MRSYLPGAVVEPGGALGADEVSGEDDDEDSVCLDFLWCLRDFLCLVVPLSVVPVVSEAPEVADGLLEPLELMPEVPDEPLLPIEEPEVPDEPEAPLPLELLSLALPPIDEPEVPDEPELPLSLLPDMPPPEAPDDEVPLEPDVLGVEDDMLPLVPLSFELDMLDDLLLPLLVSVPAPAPCASAIADTDAIIANDNDRIVVFNFMSHSLDKK